MALQTLPQSAPKYEFLDALSLDANRQKDKHLYCEMKLEASRVYEDFLAHSHNLRPEHQGSSPPWSYAQFSEIAISTAVRSVYEQASASTIRIYDKGSPNGENWVIKWMVYHVCRYRDDRNRPSKKRGKDQQELSSSGSSEDFEKKSGRPWEM